MQWIINELSFDNQFTDIKDFETKMQALLDAKDKHKPLTNNLLCSRELGHIQIFSHATFSQIVMKQLNPTLKKRILSWVSKNGPFWTDDITTHQENYFEYNNIDVTDLGLGECARKSINLMPISAYSFAGQYSQTRLLVEHGLPEDRLGQYPIKNLYEIAQLKQSADATQPAPINWQQALNRLIESFPNLQFSTDIYNQLAPNPFSIELYKNISLRCQVLVDYINSRDETGEHTAKSTELLQKYFHGDNAWFSDSSATEKSKFKNQLIFKDLHTQQNRLFPFHGKIKTQVTRIHFEWPISPTATTIQIVYIGPKLTKQ